ncbi:MAG: hypothetical protein LBQ61_04590 [Spirochaetales bacterium]|jgi:hypothetical protein|nr:hypothetical protein [Spirochaetales bacterium]
MSLEDDVRKGTYEGLNDYKRTQEWKAKNAAYAAHKADVDAYRTKVKSNIMPEAGELIRNGDYLEAANITGRFLLGFEYDVEIAILMEDALYKWGNACAEGGGKYPKDKAKAMEIWKTAAWYGHRDARKKLKSRGALFIKVRHPRWSQESWYTIFFAIAIGIGLCFFAAKLLNIYDASWYTQRFIIRWVTNIAVFCAGVFVPYIYWSSVPPLSAQYWFSSDWSVENLRKVRGKPKLEGPSKPLLVAMLAASFIGWAPKLVALLRWGLRLTPAYRWAIGFESSFESFYENFLSLLKF